MIADNFFTYVRYSLLFVLLEQCILPNMKQEIFHQASEKLHGLTGVAVESLTYESHQNGDSYDLHFTLRKHNHISHWAGEIKRHVTKTSLIKLTQRRLMALEDGFENFIVISEYIAPSAKEALVHEKVCYLDAMGNAHIEAPGLFIHNETGKSISPNKHSKSRAFTKAGLKVVFSLLTKEGFLNKPYRTIEAYSNTSLDTINKVFKALLQEGYIIKESRNTYRFIDRDNLIQKWVEHYNVKLRPSLLVKTFRPIERSQDWRNIPITVGVEQWGGAVAADMMIRHLIPDKWILYSQADQQHFIKEFAWVPDSNGKITVYQKFWTTEDHSEHAHPLIVYSDLLASNDPRYTETAKLIYEKYLSQ